MKRTKIMTLLLALTMVLAMSQLTFANDYTAKGGDYTFNGSKIVSSSTTSIKDQIDRVEPGDTVDIQLTYTNDHDETTEWYLHNEVLQTLEANAGMQGGYTYVLTNNGPDGSTVIFDSEAVGGGTNGAGQGLKQATNATDDFFFIQELEPGESGMVSLKVGLEGESQINSYQNKAGEIEFQFAVEKIAEGETVYKHVKGVNTGDTTNIILPLVTFIAALLLLIFGIRSWRKDRKDGDRA